MQLLSRRGVAFVVGLQYLTAALRAELIVGVFRRYVACASIRRIGSWVKYGSFQSTVQQVFN
jgi:hypothetical protein